MDAKGQCGWVTCSKQLMGPNNNPDDDDDHKNKTLLWTCLTDVLNVPEEKNIHKQMRYPLCFL